jgi:hypothetical protein
LVGKYRKIGKFGKIKTMRSKYSKIRISLIVLLFAFWILFVLSETIYPTISNILPILLVFIGSVLFVFNRRWSDYISFSIFVFGFVISITYKIKHCLNSEFCGNAIYESLTFDKVETLFIFVSILIVAYLFTTFFRVKNI